MFISGDVNVYPAEIETKWGEISVAFLVARAEVKEADVLSFLEGQLAATSCRAVFSFARPCRVRPTAK
jgi:hypothetical protein